MASNGIISVKCSINKDRFADLSSDLRQSASDGIYDALVYARDAVRPYTPFMPDKLRRHGGPHLNQPEIHRYSNGTSSIQWRANNKGYYYAAIQNNNPMFYHPNGGEPGFIDAVYDSFSRNAPEIIVNLMHSKGW